MTRLISIAFVVLAAVGCSKGSSQRTHSDIVRDYAAGVQAAADIMNRMKDAASAEEGANAARRKDKDDAALRRPIGARRDRRG